MLMRLLLTAAFVASVTAQTAGTLAFTGSLTDTGCYDTVADSGWVRHTQSSHVPPFSLHPTPSHFSSLAISLHPFSSCRATVVPHPARTHTSLAKDLPQSMASRERT